MPRDPEKDGRCDRFAKLRAALELTGVEFTERLNEAAVALGFAAYWTPPKVTNTEGGGRDLQYADLAVLERVDPEKRSWFWWAFGREQPEAEDTQKHFPEVPKGRSGAGAGRRAQGHSKGGRKRRDG